MFQAAAPADGGYSAPEASSNKTPKHTASDDGYGASAPEAEHKAPVADKHGAAPSNGGYRRRAARRRRVLAN